MRGRGRGGRFGGRGGFGGGGITALDHLRDAAEDLGLDPRTAHLGNQQGPPSLFPDVGPLYSPGPLSDAEGQMIQHQRELVHRLQQSPYYLRPAPVEKAGQKRASTSANDHIARYSDKYREMQAPAAAKASGKSESVWDLINVPTAKDQSAVYIPEELLPPQKKEAASIKLEAPSIVKRKDARDSLKVKEETEGGEGPKKKDEEEEAEGDEKLDEEEEEIDDDDDYEKDYYASDDEYGGGGSDDGEAVY